MKYISIPILFLCSSILLSVENDVHWYHVKTKEYFEGSVYSYYGSSTLTMLEIQKKIIAKEPLILNNLIAWNSEKKVIPYSEYDKNVIGDIMIMPDNLSSIMPLAGDPKTVVYGDRTDVSPVPKY